MRWLAGTCFVSLAACVYCLSAREVASSSSDNKVNGKELKAKTIIQGEICRQFLLLDWMFELERERGDLKNEEIQILEELQDFVREARVYAEATYDDIDEMPFLPVMGPAGGDKLGQRRKDLSFFPRYLELPGEVVREHILGYLTNHEDKLKLIEAIPSEVQLMGWEKNALLFEMVCDILIEREELNEKDVYALSQVSEGLRDVVKESSEYKLQSFAKGEYPYPHALVDLNELINHFPEEERDFNENGKYILNPYPALVTINLQSDVLNETLSLLERVGSKIWYCHLEFHHEWQLSLLEKTKIISSCLRLIPDIRKFAVNGSGEAPNFPDHPTPQFLRSQLSLLDIVPLPDLRYLHTLIADGGCPGFEVVNRKLVDKYAHQLVCLWVVFEYPIFDASEESLKINAPNLRNMKLLTATRTQEYSLQVLEGDMRYLKMFRDSPLKALHLFIPDDDIRARFKTLLPDLYTHFGQTLKMLEVDLVLFDAEPGRIPPATSLGSAWLYELDFSKLKSFSLRFQYKPFVFDFGYLLLFPSLEEIRLLGSVTFFDDAESFRCHRYIQLPGGPQEMRGSNLWKLLPRLQEYHVEYLIFNLFHPANVVRGREIHATVTREDCSTKDLYVPLRIGYLTD